MAETLPGADIAFASAPRKVPILAAAGKKFIILKATQDDFEDDGFKDGLAAVRDEHLVPGAYHFLINSKKVKGFKLDPSITPTAQANNFLDTVHLRNGASYAKIMYALDVENFTRTKKVSGRSVVYYKSVPTLDDVDEFVARFQERLPDRILLIYTSIAIWHSFGNPKITARYGSNVRLWLADWVGHADFTIHLGGLTPMIHQWGQKVIKHIGLVDLDATQLTIAQLKDVAGWPDAGDPDDPPGDPDPPPPPDSLGDNEPDIGCSDEDGGGTDGSNDGPFDLVLEDGESAPGTTYDADIGYNADIAYNGNAAVTLVFEANITPVNPDDDVEFDWATHDGSARAGTHYTAASGHAVISAGDGSFSTPITLLDVDEHGDKTFQVVGTNPVNCVIVRPTATMTLHYTAVPVDPGGNAWETLDAYNSMPNHDLVYNEFFDMRHRNRCTAYAGALVATILNFVKTGREVAFDPDKLFVSAGGPLCPEKSSNCLPSGHCCGFKDTTILRYMKQHGIHRENPQGTLFKLDDFGQLTADTRDDLVVKIKKWIYLRGCVYFSSIFYSDWNSAGSHSWTDGALPDHGNDTSSVGHSWVTMGWNDSVAGGAFRIQSSHGSKWASNGRAWLPYDYIVRRYNSNGSPSDPWMRFFKVIPKP